MKVSGLIFSCEKCEERKRMSKEFQKEFENKRISHTHFYTTNESTEKEEKKNCRKRKKQKMSSPVCGKNTTFFSFIKTGK